VNEHAEKQVKKDKYSRWERRKEAWSKGVRRFLRMKKKVEGGQRNKLTKSPKPDKLKKR
jgi:hypothetical protein